MAIRPWQASAGGVLLCAAVARSPAVAQCDSGVFYRGLPYGSQATFSPIVAVLHSGYYDFQVDNRGDNPLRLPYAAGFENLLHNLANPVAAIDHYGWSRFASSELLPTADRNRAQWVPNYFGHILGEGMVYRNLLEWYRCHGFRHPSLLAVLTLHAGALLNEVVENGSFRGVNVDPIADLYIFNPLSILLLQSESVARFLGTRLALAYWPRQAAYEPGDGNLNNVGYRIVARVYPGSSPVGLFASYGMQGLLGVTYRLGRGMQLGMGAGLGAVELVDIQQPGEPRVVTAALTSAGGVFLDRDGSLLVSLVLTRRTADRATLNVYPGLLRLGTVQPGLSAAWSTGDVLKLGVHLRPIPVGLGLRSAR